MKAIFTSILILATAILKAQTVNIPDPNFKQMLIIAGVDLNGDGDIQNSEAEAVTNLSVGPLDFVFGIGYDVTDYTGIKAFVNMKTFNLGCWLNAVSVLDLSGMENLENLILNGYGDFASTHGISNLNVTGCKGLKKVYIEMQRIISLDFSTCANLESLELIENLYLQAINTSNLINLTKLRLVEINRLQDLDLHECKNLLDLSIVNSFQMKTLNISGLVKLISLISYFKTENLIATNCTNLKSLGTYDFGGVTNFLDVSGCINLQSLSFFDEASFLNTLDLSSCYNLAEIYLPKMRTNAINLKNGSLLSGAYISASDNHKINICVDEFEPKQLKNLLIASGGYNNNTLSTTFNMCTCCKFLPNSTYNTIKGTVRLDLNNNGCDNNDLGLANIPIKIKNSEGDSLTRFTIPSGQYAHYPYAGTFTIMPSTVNPNFSFSPASASIRFDTANRLVSVADFCLVPVKSINDLEISITPLTPTRTVTNPVYNITYNNKGTTTMSGYVELRFDNSKMSYVTATTAPNTVNNGVITWNFSSLPPFASKGINVTFNLLPAPVNNLGDELSWLAIVNPISGDETPADNSATLVQKIVGSWDPNFKECLQGPLVNINKANDYVYYIVHFQNLGTDTAFSVAVTDDLSDKLDLNTFGFVSSSFPCNITLRDNQAEFFFDNIQLPQQAIDDAGSNGFVVYRVKPKNGQIIAGDVISNNAAIYFDFNLPVITNTTTTTFADFSPLPVKLAFFSVSSQNQSNELYWQAFSTDSRVKFEIEKSLDGLNFNKIGTISGDYEKCKTPFNFVDQNLNGNKSFYRIKITGDNNKPFYSQIIVAGNGKLGFNIKAISGNTVYFSNNRNQVVDFKIISSDGKSIHSERRKLLAGNSTLELDLPPLSSGVYILKISNNAGETLVRKFIK